MRRLPVKLAMAVLAVGGGYWAAMTLAPPATNKPAEPTHIAVETTGAVPSEPGGAIGAHAVSSDASGSDEQLILDVLDTLERRPNIVAKLRQSARVGDERLTGEGEFWQQGVGNQRRTRWELKTLVAGETAFVTQVYDGDAVWTDRKLPGARKVTRVDMPTLRRELVPLDGEPQGRGGVGESMPELLARGGLSQLAASLHRSFSFGPRTSLKWGERTVLAAVGQWRPEQLQRTWPGLSTSNASDWPAHLPHHVMLYIDVKDRFPYLIEYRSATQAALATSTSAYYPAHAALATYEFRDVQFAATMPADTFTFAPPENNWTDVTARVIEELRPAPAPVADASTARREGTWR